MNNGDQVEIYAADNRWHDAIYIGETQRGSHVVEIDGEIWEGAFVRKR